MMPRPVGSSSQAANDNHRSTAASREASLLARDGGAPLVRSPWWLRIGGRALLIIGFSGLVLVALSGAVLVGLAAIGMLAAGVGGYELARRTLRRKSGLGALDHQAAR